MNSKDKKILIAIVAVMSLYSLYLYHRYVSSDYETNPRAHADRDKDDNPTTCPGEQTLIYWYSPRTGDHYTTCEDDIPIK